jgi:hypothetical protein
VVSAADVRNAEASLRSRGPTFPSRLLEPVGGLLAGAGLAQLYSVLTAAKSVTPSDLAYLLAAISTIAGIGLLALGLLGVANWALRWKSTLERSCPGEFC